MIEKAIAAPGADLLADSKSPIRVQHPTRALTQSPSIVVAVVEQISSKTFSNRSSSSKRTFAFSSLAARSSNSVQSLLNLVSLCDSNVEPAAGSAATERSNRREIPSAMGQSFEKLFFQVRNKPSEASLRSGGLSITQILVRGNVVN